MHQTFGKYLMFRNRLEKVYRHIGKQARKQGISCYRVYDHDLPEFPFIIELFEDAAYVSEYKRRHGMMDDEHAGWMNECVLVISEVLSVHVENIFVKTRQRKEGRKGQYQKLEVNKNERIVKEGGLKFIVNLSDYLDTGLFLDHRITRQLFREEAENKRVLNLFCYTGSFSVYAASGNAKHVSSVDLSNTYLNWATKNMELNFSGYNHHEIIQADAKEFLKNYRGEKFHLVMMDPPTFSNSKKMEGILDIQKDHPALLNDCLELMVPGGVLYFSTNYTKFILQEEKIKAKEIRDITLKTTPFDFKGKLKRQCFRILK